VQAKTIYEVLLEGTIPVISKIRIQADTEWEAAALGQRIAESQKSGVKTTALEIDAYSADFLAVEGVGEISPIEPNEAGKVWNREEIEELLGETPA
jgi:hypothetical protein